MLDQIAAEEAAETTAAQAAETATAEAAQADEREAMFDGWRQAVNAAKDLITSALPEATPVWTAERCDNFAAALARCDEHYQWGGAGKLLSNPLVGLAVAGLPLAIGTANAYKEVKAKAEAQAAIARAQSSASVGLPGGGVITPVVPADTGPAQPSAFAL